MKITVEKGKKSVSVLSFGQAPFAVEDHAKLGRVFIPNGFKVETHAAKRNWIGETRVNGGLAEYRFTIRDDPNQASVWWKTPTGAFKDINERIRNVHYKPGTNGALLIGITYQPLQDEIRRIFTLNQLNGSDSSASSEEQSTEESQSSQTSRSQSGPSQSSQEESEESVMLNDNSQASYLNMTLPIARVESVAEWTCKALQHDINDADESTCQPFSEFEFSQRGSFNREGSLTSENGYGYGRAVKLIPLTRIRSFSNDYTSKRSKIDDSQGEDPSPSKASYYQGIIDQGEPVFSSSLQSTEFVHRNMEEIVMDDEFTFRCSQDSQIGVDMDEETLINVNEPVFPGSPN